MKAFQEGKEAFQAGNTSQQNPYPAMSQEGRAWGMGWLVAKEPGNWSDIARRYEDQPG
jgi:hypothetical protein